MLAQNTKVLQERYTLTKLLSSSSQQQSWLATDQDGGPVLAKTWYYPSEQPTVRVNEFETLLLII